MIRDPSKKNDIFSLTYCFTPQETEMLAHFLRKHEDEIPVELAIFSKTVEDTVYNSMSIEEAEKFYS